jgi:hypothetical protein
LYVEADLKRRPPDIIVADGIEHCRAFCPNGFAFEADAFQSLFAPLFGIAAGQQRVHLPIYQISHEHVPKPVRIRRLTHLLSRRQVRFKARSPGTALLVQQLQDFPVGDHDDGPDALEMAYRLGVFLYGTPGERVSGVAAG